MSLPASSDNSDPHSHRAVPAEQPVRRELSAEEALIAELRAEHRRRRQPEPSPKERAAVMEELARSTEELSDPSPSLER